MARKPDTPCAGCGKLLWDGMTSLPAGQRRCRACRPGKTRAAICAHCSTSFTSIKGHGRWTECCSVQCAAGRRKVLMPPHDPEARRKKLQARYRARNHERRARKRAAFDKVTPDFEQILREKARRCPLCGVRLIGEPFQHASKELDHMVPLNAGGTHTIGNVRIICRLCNLRRPDDGSDYTGPVTLWAAA